MQAVNILDDNDGVIYQHTDAQSQSGQGDDIHCDPGKVHQHDGKDHTDRNRDGNSHGRPDIPEEDQQNDDRQYSTDHQVLKDRRHHLVNVDALVHQGCQMQAGIAFLRFLHVASDAFCHIGCRIAVLLLQRQDNSVIAVDLCIVFICIGHQFDPGYILQTDLTHVVFIQIKKQKIFQFFLTFKLISDTDQIGLPAFCHISGRHGEILGRQYAGDHVFCDDAIQIGGIFGRLYTFIQLLIRTL